MSKEIFLSNQIQKRMYASSQKNKKLHKIDELFKRKAIKRDKQQKE